MILMNADDCNNGGKKSGWINHKWERIPLLKCEASHWIVPPKISPQGRNEEQGGQKQGM
jgi:hypothetical protein